MTEHLEALISFLRPEDGGRSCAASSELYRPQFFYENRDWDVRITFEDRDAAAPGETVSARLSFLSPAEHRGRVLVGTPFLLREGKKIVAFGSVTAILSLS